MRPPTILQVANHRSAMFSRGSQNRAILRTAAFDPRGGKAPFATGSGRPSHAMTSQSRATGGPNPCEPAETI